MNSRHTIAYLWKQFYIAIELEFPQKTYQKDSEINAKVHTRFSRWCISGIWERVFPTLAEDADNEYAMSDATIVRAHQHSPGAKDSTAQQEDIGHSKGGLSTKIHGVVGALGNPTPTFLTTIQTSILDSCRCTITNGRSGSSIRGESL